MVYIAAEILFRINPQTPARSNSVRIAPSTAARPVFTRARAGAFRGSTYIFISNSISVAMFSARQAPTGLICTEFESESSSTSSTPLGSRSLTPAASRR